MPKKYPVEVRVFAVLRKREGHSWDRVAEMVKRNFGLDPPPSRRQMTKWVTKEPLPDVVMKEMEHRLPTFTPEWMSTQRDALTRVLSEGMTGKDFRIVMAKWMFSQLKWVLGPDQLRIAWAEFTEEEERLEKGVKPSAINLKLEEGDSNERTHSKEVQE
jgi:hypothetical protein